MCPFKKIGAIAATWGEGRRVKRERVASSPAVTIVFLLKYTADDTAPLWGRGRRIAFRTEVFTWVVVVGGSGGEGKEVVSLSVSLSEAPAE